MKKVVYISGSRSDYSLMRGTLAKLDSQTDLTVIATCMHLSPQYGHTVKEIIDDNLQIRKLDMLFDSDTLSAMVKSIGIGMYGLANLLEEILPDLVLVEGDRGESLAGAIAGAHLNVPIVHHGGGDIGGSIDNKIRYAITQFSDYHLVGNPESQKRLIQMGIQKNKIFNVGEPGLDDIYENNYTPKDEIIQKYSLNPEEPVILLIFHPNTFEHKRVDEQILNILSAIKKIKVQTIAIYSNADAGGRVINQTLDIAAKEIPFLSVYPHIWRRDFLGVMNACTVMVGNSSAGLVELPSFKKPFVCIGSRQQNRLRAGNTIDVGYNTDEILRGIKKALYEKRFKEHLDSIENPYGAGKSSGLIVKRILDILEEEKCK